MGDELLCRCGHDKASHEYEYSPVKGHCSHGGTNGVPECRCARYTPAPSPARDDAETAIAGLLAEHRFTVGGCFCGWGIDRNAPMMPTYEAHVASVIAAHMAAPDELTALRERVHALTTAARLITEDPGMNCHPGYEALRALLGDA